MNNVSFKGTYAILGNTVLHKPVKELTNFFNSTKEYRTSKTCAYFDSDTCNYFINVQDDKEVPFEQIASIYNIKIRKADPKGNLVPVVRDTAIGSAEMESLVEVIAETAYSRQKKA